MAAKGNIPAQLRRHRQFVFAHPEDKVPKDARTGEAASSTDPSTWRSYTTAARRTANNGHLPGFVFTEDDEFAGVDLDGCRNPKTGKIHPEARKLIRELDSYAEVSPSGYGVKLIVAASKVGQRSKTTDVPWRAYVKNESRKDGGLGGVPSSG